MIPVTPPEEAEIMNLGSGINTTFTEYTPFITPDEVFLYFESDRPGSVGVSGNFDIWHATNRTPRGKIPEFALPVNAGTPLNSPGFDGLPSLRQLPDGSYEIYFTSYPDSVRMGPDESNIYVSRQVGGAWSEPRPVEGVNSDFHDRMPSISPDGRFLYFSSDRPGGYGKDDIWISEFDPAAKRWRTPVNAGPAINTYSSEISPSIHVDTITLYFSSNRAGGLGSYDIYVTQKLNTGEWKIPANLGVPFNTRQDDEYPTVVRSGEFMYFTSNRPGGLGGFDIYRARVPVFAKPVVIISLEGKVFEENTTKGLEANVSIRGDERRFDISSGLPDGIFKADFLNNRIYEILVTAPGYEPYRYSLDLHTSHETRVIKMDFPLRKIQSSPDAYQLVLQYFDSEGNNVAARAIYRFDPVDKMTKKVNDNSIILPVPGNTTAWNTFIEGNRLMIFAEAEGFLSRDLDISLITLLEKPENKGSQKIFIPIEMRRIDADPAKTGPMKLAGTVYFDTGVSDKVTQEEMKKIAKILEALQNTPGAIEIHGHTDHTGSVQTNIPLSMNRSRFVRRQMIAFGIPEERIRTFGHSYSRPAVKEVTAKDRQKNRRVEIFIREEIKSNDNRN